jgi:acyl-CoA synthetase (NDP forming)
VDLAAAEGVPLAVLAPTSTRALGALLDPGLPAANPLDAWSAGGPEYHEKMCACFEVLMRDPGAALGAVVHARGPDGRLYGTYVDYLRRGHAASGKPAFLVGATQGVGADPLVVDATRAGFPVLDGVAKFLRGVRALLSYREFLDRAEPAPPATGRDTATRWRARLLSGQALTEQDALQCLADFGVPAVAAQTCYSLDEALAFARRNGFPVVLKTAEPGIEHKSDIGGVHVRLADDGAVRTAYSDLARRLGRAVTVAARVPDPAVEMFLGMRRDPQFGPVVILGFGGIHAELLQDAVTVLPPFDAATAARMLDRLRLRPLLDGKRGAPASDVGAFCRAAAAFSVLAATLGDIIEECDVNPVRVRPQGCVAVDALMIPRTATGGHGPEPE